MALSLWEVVGRHSVSTHCHPVFNVTCLWETLQPGRVLRSQPNTHCTYLEHGRIYWAHHILNDYWSLPTWCHRRGNQGLPGWPSLHSGGSCSNNSRKNWYVTSSIIWKGKAWINLWTAPRCPLAPPSTPKSLDFVTPDLPLSPVQLAQAIQYATTQSHRHAWFSMDPNRIVDLWMGE